jgi:predicted permease
MAWYRRFINVLRPNRVSADIEREMAFHMAERADDLMAGGMSERDARREARRRFGNPGVQKERTRDTDVLTWLESIGADVRYALRSLRASPGFALVTIVSLGTGIGANTAIFSLINAVVLRTLPVSRPEELVQVTRVERGDASPGGVVTNPIWEQVRDRQDVFSGVFAYGSNEFDLTGGGEVRRAAGYSVSGDFFSTLGVKPALGRLLTRADDVRGCPAVAVLGYGFWRSEYGESESVIGSTISLDRVPYEIVGVAPPSFFGIDVGRSVQVYRPLCRAPNLDARSTWYLYIIGRPKPGIPPAQVVSGLTRISPLVFGATVPQDWGVTQKSRYLTNTLSLRPVANGLSSVRQEYRQALMVLMAVVGLVLLIACANVASLLLARAASRGREMAIRLAIGAARRRLVRQLLTESVLLAGVGAGVGILFARWGNGLLIGMLSRGPFTLSLDLGLDVRVLVFTLTVAVATGILFGLAPAWRSTRIDPQVALKAGGRGIAEGHSRFAIGKALVTGQIALSLVLVIAAGLLLGSFRALATSDPGFRREGVLIVDTDFRTAGYAKESYATVRRDLLARYRALPGVRSASASPFTPISGSAWNDVIRVDGFAPRSDDDALVMFNEVSDGYFATLGTALVAGRDFDARDRSGAPPVAIINETLARKFFNGVSPLGKTYRLVVHDSLGPPIEIVGVVRDAKYLTLRETAYPTVYLAMEQGDDYFGGMSFELLADGPASALAGPVKAATAEVNRSLPITLTPLSRQLDASLTRDRLLATLSGFFGLIAVLLATVGLYGTLSYSVARRRNEIGIRVALGAARGRVIRLVLGEVSRMVVVGIAIGLLVAFWSTRWVRSFLYGLSASDPRTIAGSVVLLAAVAIAAAAMPAWRAARVDPITALRDD